MTLTAGQHRIATASNPEDPGLTKDLSQKKIKMEGRGKPLLVTGSF